MKMTFKTQTLKGKGTCCSGESLNSKLVKEEKLTATLGLSGCETRWWSQGAPRWQGCTTAALVLSIRERQSLEIALRQVICLLDSPQQDADQKLLSLGLHQQLLRPIMILLPKLQSQLGLSCPCPQSGLGGFSYMGLQLKLTTSSQRCLYRTVIKHVCLILD